MTSNNTNEPAVFRQLAIPLSIFDRIKQVQRGHAAATGEQLTLIQTISTIVREHLKNEEREEQNQPTNLPRLLTH